MGEYDTLNEKLVNEGHAVVILSKNEPETSEVKPEEENLLNGLCQQGTSFAQTISSDRDALQFTFKNNQEEGPSLPSPVIATPSPPDGGIRAWVVMFASFLCNGIIFGTINSGGVIFAELHDVYTKSGIENPASLASITLSLAIGTTFFLSLVAGILTDKFGIMRTTVVGGVIATLGMFLSSVYYTQANILIVTMGLVFGTGASLAYTPSLVILGHYFYKKLGIANGFVTAGSSLFTIALTQILKVVISLKGLKVAFQMLSGFMAILVLCGLTFKPFLPEVTANLAMDDGLKKRELRKRCHNFFGNVINYEIWKNKRYVIWTLAIPTALFGYFVPYVHLVEYVRTVLGEEANSEILIQCIGGTSGLGRIVFGLIADKPWVNRIILQQISFFCIGALTMLLTAANHFWIFVVIALGMGLFDGCFISLLGPIAFDIVGPAGASQAIGCLLAFCSIPLTIGPFIAGVLYDHLGSYLIPFLCAGIPPILGCFALCLIRCIKEPSEGMPGSPAVEVGGEKKNNTALRTPSNPSLPQPLSQQEAQSLIPDNVNYDFLQVDVRRLINLQRESCV